MKPLSGITVLDLTRVLAGPYAAMLLADFGADVIKIEQSGVGDDSRAFGPFVNGESAYYMSLNRNKRSITLNLKTQEAKDIFKKLVAKADVVIENYRPGTMEKFGLGYDVLKEINPGLIYASCSGFGSTGPYRLKPAYDIIVQAMGGIMSITGQEDGVPTRVGTSVGDIFAGIFCSDGIKTALYHRAMTGEGQKIDVSMLDCQVAVLENAISRYFATGMAPKPIGNRHPSVTPFEALTASDGHVIVAVGNDSLWAKFCKLLGKEELIKDSRFDTNANRTANEKELKDILDACFLNDSIDGWLNKLENIGIPCSPINTIDRVVNDPQIKARDMIVEVEHQLAGKTKFAGIPVKMSLTPGSVDSPAPTLGQHTYEVMSEMLGLTKEEVDELKAQDVI